MPLILAIEPDRRQASHLTAMVRGRLHAAAGDSERRDAVRMLAGRAAFVVLLSATPHNGVDATFRELCSIGAVGDGRDQDPDRLLVFRRKRTEIRGLRLKPSI